MERTTTPLHTTAKAIADGDLVASSEDIDLVSTEAVNIFLLICFGVVCQIICVFGIGTNIINIVCFVKQGFKEAVNVSLLGLAISDLGCLVLMIWSNICFIPAFQELDLSFDPLDTQYLITGVPRLMFTRVTSSITALVTLERCLCITMPLKVGSIFTPRRVAIIIGCVCLAITASILPVYYVSKYELRYYPSRNRTVVGLVFTDDRAIADQISFAINNVLFPFSALIIIIICMVIMAVKLKEQARWRAKNASSSKADSRTERHIKLAKAIVMVSTLFVVCFTPTGVIFFTMILVPGFSYHGNYENTLFVCYGFSIMLEATNSAMNIFIYYRMSSKYRAIVREMFFKKLSHKL